MLQDGAHFDESQRYCFIHCELSSVKAIVVKLGYIPTSHHQVLKI
jgi:hypothetical protein